MIPLREKLLKTTIVILIIVGFIFTQSALGIVSPAITYCQDLGYERIVEKTAEGEIGFCKLPDGTTVEEWDFLKGKSGQEWSYCQQEGYTLKTVSDPAECSSIFSEDCAVCVLEEGVEIEASKLLEFEIQRETCGNRICDSEENFQNCPQDCLGKKKPLWPYIGGILFVTIVLCFLIYKGTRKWREKKPTKPMPKI